MNLDQCLGANRPLIFVTAESDVEVLKHVSRNFPNGMFYVYTTTAGAIIPLNSFISPSAGLETDPEMRTTITVLDSILKKEFSFSEECFSTFIFLDCDSFINDPQIIRKIKDILTRYQVDENFSVNLVMVSHRVCVPPPLERLSEMVFFDLPSEDQLKAMSEDLIKKLKISEPSQEVVNNLKGMTLFEMEQAYLQSHHLYKNIELSFIREFKKNAIAKTDLISLMEDNVSFEDVGGLDRLKAWIKKSAGGWTIEGKKFGLPLLKGVLLVGIPGTGKTLCCKTFGKEWGLPVVDFDPSKVFSSRVGDSETNMRRVLHIIEGLAPCILMVDEIEKGLAGLQSSSYSDSGVTARVIRSFLIWMQECTKPVFVVATANDIRAMPPELISRFDETFFVNLPQKVEREAIFRIHLRKLQRDPEKYDINALAEASQRMSGREIEQTLKEAMYDCFHGNTDLTTKAVLDVLQKKTTITTTMAEQLQKLMQWVGWDKNKQDGLRARFASTPDPMDLDKVRSEIDNLLSEVEKSPRTGEPPVGSSGDCV